MRDTGTTRTQVGRALPDHFAVLGLEHLKAYRPALAAQTQPSVSLSCPLPEEYSVLDWSSWEYPEEELP